MTSQIRREPTRRNADSRRARTMAVQRADGLSYLFFEDAFIVECVDVETGQPLPDGETGNLVVTCLYKTGNQHIRYNIQDLFRIISREPCACGGTHLRTDRFLGRSDTMVKLRGIYIWPEACGNVVNKDPRVSGEWFCYAETRQTPRGVVDQMTIMVEHKAGVGDTDALRSHLEERLKVGLDCASTSRW